MSSNEINNPKLEKFDFRDAVFGAIEKIMVMDSDAIILTNDMGAVGLDKISQFAHDRVINVGITEQNMMSVASGLALSGKKVFVYGIISHIIFRALEQIKLDICVQNLPIILVGVGAGLAYGVDGPTHQGTEDISVIRSLPNMNIYNPCDAGSASFSIESAYHSKLPSFIRMDKELLPRLYSQNEELESGVIRHQLSSNSIKTGVIITSGVIVWNAIKAMEMLSQRGVDCIVIDVLKIKPFDRGALEKYCRDVSWVCVVDEAVNLGGLAEMVGLSFVGKKLKFFEQINLGSNFIMGSAKREWAWKKFGLDASGIAKRVSSCIELNN